MEEAEAKIAARAVIRAYRKPPTPPRLSLSAEEKRQAVVGGSSASGSNATFPASLIGASQTVTIGAGGVPVVFVMKPSMVASPLSAQIPGDNMRKRTSILALTTFSLSLGLAHASTPSATVPAPPAPVVHRGAMQDEATRMLLAQRSLQSAEENLLHVANEYGGHRQKANQAITTALNELKLAQAQQQPDKK